ncbi:MAG TPA: hypothetical protein VIX17_00440 [Pyrinomonadaceae bacterium]|jgi:hypothetical protein
MSNETFEKKAEFLIEQQAQFAAQIGQLEHLVARLAQATSDRIQRHNLSDHDEKISALISSQIQTEENVKKTNDDLRNLIAVVDRYFREGRNGESKV